MLSGKKLSSVIKHLALGKTMFPQEFTLGLPDPQTEITVWLRGTNFLRDVSRHISTACAEPLTICIGGNDKLPLQNDSDVPVTLVFAECIGRQRTLGEIGLRFKQTLATPQGNFHLFEPLSSHNYCLPKTRMALHYLLHAYRQWRRDNTQGIQMSFLERRASMVTFIRPHPILLVSVGSLENGNIFPMNLCGDLGHGHFGFALRTERVAGTLVANAGYAALSSVPEEEGYLAYRMANHHTKERIDWTQLPFTTRHSKSLGIPVPVFAQRVREITVETSLAIGSHRFFVARILDDEQIAEGPAFCSVHGFYQYWRLKAALQQERESKRSLARDAFHKRERHPAKP